jgi:hypothetical protein
VSSIAITLLQQFADQILSVKVAQTNLSYLNRGSSRASGIYVALSLDATTKHHLVLNSESFWDDDAYVAVTSRDSSLVDIYPLPTSAFPFLSMIALLWLGSLSSAALRVFDALFRKSKNTVSSNANMW